MSYVIKTTPNKDQALEAIGKLVMNDQRDILVQYKDRNYLRYLETNLLLDFGSGILEAGKIHFVKAENYSKRKEDVVVDPSKPKQLEAILNGK